MAFLICCSVVTVGSAMWLKPLGKGYTVDANRAGRFTASTAKRLVGEKPGTFIVPAAALRKDLATFLIVDISTPETLAKLMVFDKENNNGVNRQG